MKLKKYDTTNCVSSKSANAAATITFNPKGCISLNAKAKELCSLKAGDKFSISQYEDEPENWYIHKDDKGFLLRSFGGNSESVATNNKALVTIMLGHLGKKGIVRMLVAGKPTTLGKVAYYGILTNTAQEVSKK